MSRREEIDAEVDREMADNNIEDTPENRLIMLEGLRDGWAEDTDTNPEKVLYQVTLDAMIFGLKMVMLMGIGTTEHPKYEFVGLRKIRTNGFTTAAAWNEDVAIPIASSFNMNPEIREVFINAAVREGRYTFHPHPSNAEASTILENLKMGEEILIVSDEDYTHQWVYVCAFEGWTGINMDGSES